MSVTCGTCKRKGMTVEHVKECSRTYYQNKRAPFARPAAEAPATLSPAYHDAAALIVPREREFEDREAALAAVRAQGTSHTPMFLMDALAKSNKADDERLAEKRAIQAREREEDELVAAYKAQRDARTMRPTTVRNDPSAPEIPDAKYAVEEDGQLKFFKVDVPTKGKWVGYTFVTMLIGAPGSWRRVKLPRPAQAKILSLIVADSYTYVPQDGSPAKHATGPEAGVLRYADKFQRCAVCESPLSDPVSRARGMGPVCAGRF